MNLQKKKSAEKEENTIYTLHLNGVSVAILASTFNKTEEEVQEIIAKKE